MIDRSIIMARDLAEAALARDILLEIVKGCKGKTSVERKAEMVSASNARIATECIAFAERLVAAMESVGNQVMDEMARQKECN